MIPPEAPAAPSGSTLARSFGAGTALDLFPGAISMTIDENRAREVLAATCPGLCLSESEKQGVALAISVLATEAAQPEGWVPSEKDAREDLKTIARRANILLTENAEVLTVTVERHVRSIRDTALRLAAVSPMPPAPLRADVGTKRLLDHRENLAVALFEATHQMALKAWSDETRAYWLQRAAAALTARQDAATDAGVEEAYRQGQIDMRERAAKVCDQRGAEEQEAFGLQRGTQNYFRARNAVRALALATQENNHAG